ncbi:MAG: formylmethanofuran dehydrogenase subunit E family protein [Candidatus Omnitrophica bacterium]|nr:formylmethanofuran dehydrogenase subunit E family protein [Candidatus Omnitrophota bacterium]
MNLNHSVNLKEAIRFHGHLGPYLVLGILAGELAVRLLKCKKYFGLKVKVWGADKKPKSCLIDGLQLSSGATYGKGNIKKFNGAQIKIEVLNELTQKKIVLQFKDALLKKLEEIKTHKDSEILARELYRTTPSQLFNCELITNND